MKKRVLSMMLVLVMILTASLTTGVEITFATEYDGWQEGLELLEGDTVVIDGNSYAYGGDASEGLELESGAGPDVNTIWTAGDGYILFHYEGVGALCVVTITLHNATIEQSGGIGSDALQLPIYYSVNMVLEGENYITSGGDGIDNQYGANNMLFEISGEGSLDIKADGNGLCVLRPTVLKSGTVRIESTWGESAIMSQNATSTFTMEGGTLVAKTDGKYASAYQSYHAGITIIGGTAIFKNTAGGSAISFNAVEGGKLSVSDAKVDVTGGIEVQVAGEASGVTDIGQYVDIADTATGTITEVSVMTVDDSYKYAVYDLEGTLTKTGALLYDLNVEGAYDEDATLETDGYEIEWLYGDSSVKTGYVLTIGKALQASFTLPENLSGTIVVAEDVDFEEFFWPILFSGCSFENSEPVTVTITGPGSLKMDMAVGDFININVILQEIDITAVYGVFVMNASLAIKDVSLDLDIVGVEEATGLGTQGGGITIENSEIYMENVQMGIIAILDDVEIIDSKISIVCQEDAQGMGILVDGGTLEINKSSVSISKAENGISASMSEGGRQLVIKDSDVTIEAEDLALQSINEIVIDHSDCNIQVSDENGIAVLSETGVTIKNILNADEVEVGSYDTGNGRYFYSILSNGEFAKSVEIQTLAVSDLVVEKTKTEYKVGDTLNLDDITVTAKYNDGTSKAVTAYTTNASALDMSVAGDKTLTISYTEDGKTVTKDITIVVAAKGITGTGDVSQNGYTLLLMFAAVALVTVCAKKRFAK